MQNLNPGLQIEDLEETERLQEIQAKMDPRTETRVRDGRLFKSGELLRRRLVHEGTLLWKTSGARLKGTQHCEKNTNKSVTVGLHRPRLCEVNLVLHNHGFRTLLEK